MHKKVAFFVLMLTGFLQASRNEGVPTDIIPPVDSVSAVVIEPASTEAFKGMKRAWKKSIDCNGGLHRKLHQLNVVQAQVDDLRSVMDIQAKRRVDFTTVENKDELLTLTNSFAANMTANVARVMRSQEEIEVLSKETDRVLSQLQLVKTPSQSGVGMDVDGQKKEYVARNKKANKALFRVYEIMARADIEMTQIQEEVQREKDWLFAQKYTLQDELHQERAQVADYSAQDAETMKIFYEHSIENYTKMNQATCRQTEHLTEVKHELQADLFALQAATRKQARESISEEV